MGEDNIVQAAQYASYIQPAWAPPSWVFGPVWSVLYVIIAVTFGWVFYQTYKKNLPTFVAVPFVLNLIFNAAFTPLQFGLENNYLASIDIILVLATIIWMFWACWSASRASQSAGVARALRWVIYANIPYLAWVSFATVLQLTITYLNA